MKQPVKDAITDAMSDYMIWQPDTGHRMIEGLELMTTEQLFSDLFTDVFKNTLAAKHVPDMIAMWKEYLKNEKA